MGLLLLTATDVSATSVRSSSSESKCVIMDASKGGLRPGFEGTTTLPFCLSQDDYKSR